MTNQNANFCNATITIVGIFQINISCDIRYGSHNFKQKKQQQMTHCENSAVLLTFKCKSFYRGWLANPWKWKGKCLVHIEGCLLTCIS